MHRLHARHHNIPLTLEFGDDVYQPGSYSEILADLMEIPPGASVADVGCGCGYLGIMAALLGAGLVIAIDPDANAVRYTARNARLNNADRLVVYQGSGLDAVAHLDVDVIVTLPPQMPFSTNFNPWRYGGPDGCDVILRLIEQASSMLRRKRGLLFLLHAGLANPAKVRRQLVACGFTWSIIATRERRLDSPEFDLLAPGLREYLLRLASSGQAQILRRGDEMYYPVWFYRAVI